MSPRRSGQPQERGAEGVGGLDGASDDVMPPTGDTPAASADAAAGAEVPVDSAVAAAPADVRPEVPTDAADASVDTPIGVLTAGEGPTAVVAKLGPDGTPGWTFAIGGPGGTATAVAVRGSSFVVAGANEQPGDFDPGPGTEVLDGGIRLLSHFEF